MQKKLASRFRSLLLGGAKHVLTPKAFRLSRLSYGEAAKGGDFDEIDNHSERRCSGKCA